MKKVNYFWNGVELGIPEEAVSVLTTMETENRKHMTFTLPGFHHEEGDYILYAKKVGESVTVIINPATK